MSVTLMATQAYPYAGRSVSKGETFEASERDAHILKLLGRATDAPSDRVIQTCALASEPASEPEVGSLVIEAHEHSSRAVLDVFQEIPRQKRRYRRRDLVPEP